MTELEVLNLIEYAEHERDKAMIALLWDIGARIDEIGILHIKHISFDEYGAIVNVRGKKFYEILWGRVPVRSQVIIHGEIKHET